MQRNLIDQFLKKAQLGRECYISLKNNYNIHDEAYIFIVDHSDKQFYLYTIEEIINFKKNNNSIEIYILLDECMKNDKYLFELQCIFQPSENITYMLMLYNLYQFTDKLYIFSPKLPSSRSAYSLVEHGILSKKEFIKVGILKNNNS